jgi:hypothetical protein
MTDAPILLGLSGATFLMTAETGGMIQSFSVEVRRKRLDVYDASVGYTAGKVYHDPSATYTVRVIKTGSTGVSAAAPGVAVTLANTIGTANGAPGGTIYTDSVSQTHNPEGLRELSVTAVQHAV